LAIGAVGIVLLAFGGVKSNESEKTTFRAEDAELYRANITEAVEALCESVDGVGDATVFLTLAETECALYEKNKSTSGESVAMQSGDALLLGYSMPKIAGVAVVCEGGASSEVQRELTGLLSASLSLSTTKIYIAPSK